MRLRTILLMLVLSLPAFAQCTEQGLVVWQVDSVLTQLCGRAGTGPTQTTFLMQGFVGVAWLSAPSIRFDYAELYLNGYKVYVGKNDSAKPGFRMLMIENER